MQKERARANSLNFYYNGIPNRKIHTHGQRYYFLGPILKIGSQLCALRLPTMCTFIVRHHTSRWNVNSSLYLLCIVHTLLMFVINELTMLSKRAGVSLEVERHLFILTAHRQSLALRNSVSVTISITRQTFLLLWSGSSRPGGQEILASGGCSKGLNPDVFFFHSISVFKNRFGSPHFFVAEPRYLLY